ncbi:sigma-70 family RNA polymerase sigma factor [Sphingobacterium yanglingense]|uniref:RNA polymerase sigma-70 factor (ECF subfamily) n=1 Tax=Sphingobacterium yanglingense TaxID=1437280 RepID=A0A4R6WCP2_9SPHI|nr:sigma-70 family RNA polymerase sigma factor [Sphingobacterium yanglingense]TDQ75417.1 RNA polymerase sigma-70 factor (ECF subfamily) [Sphingobacterium yanglingense]TDQ75420.1 RNA polymerase sigma-70 factor (ECF subfamily) [Sphingobacterium yanglingense]
MLGIETLFKEYFVRLTVYAYPFVDSEEIAKDIVQEAFIILLDRNDILKQPEPVVKSFLYSTVKYQCLNYKRREATAAKVHTILEVEGEDEDQLTSLIRAEIIGVLHKQLSTLPDKCQHICKLIYFDGKKYDEVAKLLNISLNTVKSQRQRALRILKSKLVPLLVLLFLTALYSAI